MHKATIQVYILGGTKYQYDIFADTKWDLGVKAREHEAAIMLTGFRTNTGKNESTWYSSRWIDKIKVSGAKYNIYPAQISAT